MNSIGIIRAFETAVNIQTAKANQRNPLDTEQCYKHFTVIVADDIIRNYYVSHYVSHDDIIVK